MAQRLVTSVRGAGRIPKGGLFIGNFNILAQGKPKRLEQVQFTSQMTSHSRLNPTKGLGKPVDPKAGTTSAAFTAGGIGSDPKFRALSGCGDGQEEHEDKSSGGPRSGGMNKRQIVFTIGSAAILGVSLQDENDDDNEKQSVPADLARLVNAANSSDPQIQYDAVRSVRKLLSGDSPPVDSLISSNILPTLVNCLSSQNSPALQLEAAWALTNITAGTSPQTEAVVQAGAVPHFLKLLMSPHEDVCELALLALGNIIYDGPQLRDYVIQLGVVAKLLNLVRAEIPVTLLRNVAGVISNLCSDVDRPPSPQTLKEILSALTILVSHSDPEVLVETVSALSNITDDRGKDQIQMVINSGVLPKLVQLLNHPEVEVQMAAIKAVCNILAGSDDQTQAVLNCDVLPHLHNLIKHPNENICMGAMLILSMVTFGSSARVQAVIDAGSIPLIIAHLEKGELHTKTVAAFAISSMAVSGNKEQVAHLIDCGVIPPFWNFLNDKDSEVTEGMLCGIIYILMNYINQGDEGRVCSGTEESVGVDKIQPQQRNHENKEIGMISSNIIENNCVSDDAEEDSNLVPEVTGNARQSNSIQST